MIFDYFVAGIKEAFSYGIFRISVIILVLVVLFIIYRRRSITMQSGGSFFSSHKITNGFFYIHSGIVPGNRKILLKNINQVTIHLLRGRAHGGDRYHIELEIKNGRNKAFMLGKSRRGKEEVAEMQKQLRKNKVKLNYYDETRR